MIQNFTLSREEIRKWDFKKFQPYTYQIRDIALRCLSIVGNMTKNHFNNLMLEADAEIEGFCKSKKMPFFIPPILLCEEMMSKTKFKQRKQAELLSCLVLKKLDTAINILKGDDFKNDPENILESASIAIQQANSLLELASHKYKSGTLAEENAAKSHKKHIRLRNKVFVLLAKYFMHPDKFEDGTENPLGGTPNYAKSKSFTAQLIYENRKPTKRLPECILEKDIKILYDKDGKKSIRCKKTIEEYIDQFFGLDVC